MLNAGNIDRAIHAPKAVLERLVHVDDIGEAGVLIRNAVFVVKWLNENAKPANAAFHGDNADPQESEHTSREYLDRID